MIPKRTLTATLEISTGSMIITNRPPAFTGEADALHVNITLLDGGIAYEPTSAIQAKLYLYWPGTVNMSEQVDLDIDDNVLTGALPDTLTAVPGCPLLVIRLDDTTTGELIVAAATPIQITNVLGERVISSRPATPSEIIYVGRAPYIDETTGHWMEWDVNEGDYVDTLVPAAGSPATFTATATTLPAGSAATASITGTPQNPVLNLGIPRGADGQDSDVQSVNGLTGAVVINGSNASVSSTDDTTIAAKFGQQSDQIEELDRDITALNTITNISDNSFISLNSGLAIRGSIQVNVWKHVVLLHFTLDKTDQSAFTGSRIDVGTISNSNYHPIFTVLRSIPASTVINSFNDRNANILISSGHIYIDFNSQDIKEFNVDLLYTIN